MFRQNPYDAPAAAAFGQRRLVPRACVFDSKFHVCSFLREALDDLGFITCECTAPADLKSVVMEQRPDLLAIGLSGGGIAVSEMLEGLAALHFTGHVLVFAPRASPMTTAILSIGAQLGLTMLPLLPTPFGDEDLRKCVSALLPEEPPPSIPVDAAEALHAGWLELWYQPKIEARTLSLAGAEALVRMRHPAWGIVPPAHFLPDAADPHFGALSDFVLTQATVDWHHFVVENGHVELAANIPLRYFQHPDAIRMLTRRIPNHPAFQRLIVEIDSSEVVENPELAKQAARQLQLHNVAVAIDDVGTEWPAFMTFDEFPFVEIKVDRSLVTGCANDRLKQSACRRILELAGDFGSRTVAAGVETRADFLTMRELGFDLIQGFFFAKPMERRKFVRRVLRRPVAKQNRGEKPN